MIKSKEVFIKRFRSLCTSRSAWQAWSDFIYLSAIAISNAVDMQQDREERYLAIARQYKQNELAEMQGLFDDLANALDENPNQDFLGDMFMRLELGSHYIGQFFTPYHLSELLSKMAFADDAIAQINERGWASVNDCACGAGAMLIAARNAAKKSGIDWPNQILFVGQDVSEMTGLMCYIQLSLLGCAGYVVIADTISSPVTGWRPYGNQGFWYTPAFALNPAWPIRLEAEKCLSRKTGSSTAS